MSRDFSPPESINQSGEQVPNQPLTVPEYVAEYLALTPEEQRDVWLNDDYVAAFPQIAYYLLSPEGLAANAPETRAVFFEAATKALSIYLLGKPAAIHAKGTTPHIPAACYNYDITMDTLSSTHERQQRSRDVEGLLRIDLAGIIMLGFSLPDRDLAGQTLIDALRNQLPHAYNREMNLDRLLTVGSVARRWIKLHKLDAASGIEWDTELAIFILNQPTHVIRPGQNHPRRLPRIITAPNAHTEFSKATMRIFLDYAALYAQKVQSAPGRAVELMDFCGCLRSMGREFREDYDVQMMWLTILGAVGQPIDNTLPDQLQQREDFLREHRATRRGLRWYDPVAQQQLG